MQVAEYCNPCRNLRSAVQHRPCMTNQKKKRGPPPKGSRSAPQRTHPAFVTTDGRTGRQASPEGDDWVSDGTYHQLIGELVLQRSEVVAWLDLPVRLVVWRLLRRTYLRKKHATELWHGNREGSWRDSLRFLIWPAIRRASENRRRLPALFERHPHLLVHRLRSDAAVHSFVRDVTP